MTTILEQLRYLDEQLNNAALPADQAELVRVHRLTGLQLRQERMQQIGPAPTHGTPEYEHWDACRKEVESVVNTTLAETRLSVEGLEDSWEKWLHVEKLKAIREQLLQQTGSEGLLIDSRQVPHQGGEDKEAEERLLSAASPGQLQEGGWDALQAQPVMASPGAWDAQNLHQQLQGPEVGNPDGMHGYQALEDHLNQDQQQQWAGIEVRQDLDAQGVPLVEQELPGNQLKLCRRCNTQKPLTQFYKSKANADGYDGRCKSCDAVQCAMRRKRKERVENPTVEWKVCRRCNQNKPAADFYRNKTNGDGLYNNCKLCFSNDAANRRERLPPLEERTATAKECRRCHETKPASEFYKNKHMQDGLYTHCKSCYTEAANQRSAGRAPAETKRCRRCGSTKEAQEFYVSKMTADGLQSYCKACYAVASAARRSRHNHQDNGQDNAKEAEVDYGAAHQVLQEHLLQGQVDHMGNQVLEMGHDQMGGHLDMEQLRQMGYDPATLQAMEEAQALEQMAAQQGMEGVGAPGHHMAGMEHITILDHAQLEELHQANQAAQQAAMAHAELEHAVVGLDQQQQYDDANLHHQLLDHHHHSLDPHGGGDYQTLDHQGHHMDLHHHLHQLHQEQHYADAHLQH